MADVHEAWLPIDGGGGNYEVSDLGRVRSLRREVIDKNGETRVVPGKILECMTEPSGRKTVHMWDGSKYKRKRVHRAVLESFVGPAPEGYICRHLNDNPSDNRLSNLAWGTLSENMDDRTRNGIHHYSKRDRCGRGHIYRPETTYKQTGGVKSRSCIACCRSNATANKKGLSFDDRIALGNKIYEELISDNA